MNFRFFGSKTILCDESRLIQGYKTREDRTKLPSPVGLRFRLHGPGLPGKPDLVLAKYRTVVFVHGCFWHRHKGCKRATTPKTRKEFWMEKFEKNKARDRRNSRQLKESGWHVIVIWACELEGNLKRERTLGDLVRKLHSLSKS